MGLFSSSKASNINQTFDERFILSPSESGIALGQSGDNSTLSSPGSLAFGSAGEVQIAGLSISNFDPNVISQAYAAIAESNKLIGKISGDFFGAADSAQKTSADLVSTASETAKDTIKGSTFDISELAAWAGVLGFVFMLTK